MSALRGLAELSSLGACGCHPGGDCCDKCRSGGVHGLGAIDESCTHWKWDGSQFFKHCKDSCGRGMIKYADRHMRPMPDGAKEAKYGQTCPGREMSSIFRPTPKTEPTRFTQQIEKITHYGETIPPGCVLYGVRHGKRYLLCPDSRGRMKKMLGDPVPNSQPVEPFVWLGLAALGLYAVTRKKKS